MTRHHDLPPPALPRKRKPTALEVPEIVCNPAMTAAPEPDPESQQAIVTTQAL